MRVRTGYEAVLAHRTGETFACTAQHDGVVEAVDSNLGLIKVRYTLKTPPTLKLEWISSTASIRNKFVELAKHALEAQHPIFIAQEDATTSAFHLHDTYSFNGVILQVMDILPLLSFDQMPMNEYLPSNAKQVILHAKHPVLVKLIPTTHNPKDEVDVFKFGTKFTSAAGTYVKQSVVCNVSVGDKIHRGDVLAYNSGFFELDPFDPNQVTWKHGVMSNIALMESNDTIEDSNAMSADFSRRMETSSSHLRMLQISAKTIIRDVKPIGSVVQTTDLLCTLEDADIASLSDSDNSAMLDLLTSLNRKSPRAQYHGEIAEIDVLYVCPLSEMHPSVAALVNQINIRKSALAKAAAATHKTADYALSSQVNVGTKYHGIEFEEDTVLFMFYISEIIEHGTGDKLVIANQMKSITATIIEQPIYTETGYPVDMIFSARSVNNRIVTSPTTTGFANRVLAHLEDVVTELYFKK